jgi:hypothetical protein
MFVFLFPLTIFAALGSLTSKRRRNFVLVAAALGLVVSAGLLAAVVEGRDGLVFFVVAAGIGGSALVGLLLGGAAAWLVRRAEPSSFDTMGRMSRPTRGTA